MTDIGFTGSRTGLRGPQRRTLVIMLGDLFHVEGARTLHHGDCVGADGIANEEARQLGYRTVAHPPTNPRLRAFAPVDDVRGPLPYTDRDRVIVDATLALIGCPATEHEVVRSGSWYTIRYARQRGRRLIVIGPNGRIIEWAESTPLRVLAAEQRRDFAGLMARSSLGCPNGECEHGISQHDAEDYGSDGAPVRPICGVLGCGCGDQWRQP